MWNLVTNPASLATPTSLPTPFHLIMVHLATPSDITVKLTSHPITTDVTSDLNHWSSFTLLPPSDNQPLVLVSTVFARILDTLKSPHGPTALLTIPHSYSNLPIDPNKNDRKPQ